MPRGVYERKKKPAKPAKTAVVVPSDLTDEDGYLCLKETDLWRFRAVDAEFHKANAQLAQISVQLKMELDKHPEIRELMDRKMAMVSELTKAQKNLHEVHAAIEKKFDVDLKTCAINDDTGRLHELEGGAAGEPMRPTKRTSKRAAGPAST